MASTTYIDGTTVIYAAWLNDVNTVTYKGFPGYLSIATSLSYSDTGILGQFASNTAGYNQFIVQNTSSGTSASTSFLASNDQGTSTTNYVEMGINSSTFTGTGAFSQAGYGYLASSSTDLAIGTYGSNGIHFTVASNATDAIYISPTGFVTFPQAGGLTLPANATATTQTSTDNTTKVATTAFVTTAVGASNAPIQSVNATVASNQLLLGFPAASLQFRSATLSTGAPIVASVPTLALAVPNTATLGTISTIQSQLALLVLYAGGTPQLGIVNMSGGVNLDETTLISSTAISTSATSASVVYTNTSVTNSPFRVVGYINITEATAGTWATAPSLVQGYGGQAMANQQTLGFGQTWQNVTGARAGSTTYYNTTSRPIFVSATGTIPTSGNVVLIVSGVTVSISGTAATNGQGCNVSGIVPVGASYSVAFNTSTLSNWTELR